MQTYVFCVDDVIASNLSPPPLRFLNKGSPRAGIYIGYAKTSGIVAPVARSGGGKPRNA